MKFPYFLVLAIPMMLFTLANRILAPLYVWIPVLLAKTIKVDVVPYNIHPEVERKQVPDFWKWCNTPDEMLPGPLYETTVFKRYEEKGFFWTAYDNLAFRNVGHGLTWWMGKPAPTYLAIMSEEDQIKFGIFDKQIKFGIVTFLVGYSVYKDWYSVKTDNGFWAVPRITLRSTAKLEAEKKRLAEEKAAIEAVAAANAERLRNMIDQNAFNVITGDAPHMPPAHAVSNASVSIDTTQP